MSARNLAEQNAVYAAAIIERDRIIGQLRFALFGALGVLEDAYDANPDRLAADAVEIMDTARKALSLHPDNATIYATT